MILDSNKPFFSVAATEQNPNWEKLIRREMYKKSDNIRSEFERDYTKLLHTSAYNRLRHKNQVFFATHNDHICNRIEHVNYVSSISYSIANTLGLNTELTTAIAIGHDLGHAPFGHEGERFLDSYIQEHLNKRFWHEQNSLRFIDKLEVQKNSSNKKENLNLTYAVRDGIICHCGEVKSLALYPRKDYIDLNTITFDMKKNDKILPYTWEGCIVKISDKISYIGRDIEDAIKLNLLKEEDLNYLKSIYSNIIKSNDPSEVFNNSALIHMLIEDLCNNSSVENGISLSEDYFKLINSLQTFNNEKIYTHPRVENFKHYVWLVLGTITKTLEEFYYGENTINNLRENLNYCPNLIKTFTDWLDKFSFNNSSGEYPKLYNFNKKDDYYQAIVDYTSGMTDIFAIKVFNEILEF